MMNSGRRGIEFFENYMYGHSYTDFFKPREGNNVKKNYY